MHLSRISGSRMSYEPAATRGDDVPEGHGLSTGSVADVMQARRSCKSPYVRGYTCCLMSGCRISPWDLIPIRSQAVRRREVRVLSHIVKPTFQLRLLGPDPQPRRPPHHRLTLCPSRIVLLGTRGSIEKLAHNHKRSRHCLLDTPARGQ